MKKLIALILILILNATAFAGLTFTNDTDRVQFGSPTESDTLTELTLFGWVRPTDLSSNNDDMYVLGRNNDPTFSAWLDLLIAKNNDTVACSAHRVASDVSLRASTNLVVVNTPIFIACTFKLDSTTNTDFSIFTGTLTATVAETGSYNARVAGSDSFVSVAALNWQSGNTANNSDYYDYDGQIYIVGVANKRLSVGELRIIQYQPHCFKDASGNGVIHLWRLGRNGTSTQPDECGTASNSGTVTGASVSAGLPIRPYLAHNDTLLLEMFAGL